MRCSQEYVNVKMSDLACKAVTTCLAGGRPPAGCLAAGQESTGCLRQSGSKAPHRRALLYKSSLSSRFTIMGFINVHRCRQRLVPGGLCGSESHSDAFDTGSWACGAVKTANCLRTYLPAVFGVQRSMPYTLSTVTEGETHRGRPARVT
jgi:hypothetical protein